MSGVSEQGSSEGPGFLAGEFRVDQPHAAPRRVLQTTGERVALQPVGAVAESAAFSQGSSVVEQSLDLLREHAAQLADRLQGEQAALDRRHSDLAAQEADLEAKWESARQWLAERQQELEERAELIASREQEMVEREAAAEARSKELTKVREESLAEREQRLQCQLAELEDEKRDIQDRLAALDEDRAARIPIRERHRAAWCGCCRP